MKAYSVEDLRLMPLCILFPLHSEKGLGRENTKIDKCKKQNAKIEKSYKFENTEIEV